MNAKNGTPLTPLVHNVHRWLIAQLASRRFDEGMALKPKQLAEELGVSVSTVRIALARLVDDGWAARSASGRTRVAALPPEEPSGSAAFEALESDVDRANRYLRKRLLSGEFRSGEPLNAKQLAEEAGVHLPSIRQALEAATHVGLLEYEARRGWRIARIAVSEIRDICCMRLKLEPLALRYAVRRFRGEALQSLRGQHEVLLDNDDISLFDVRKLDVVFHITLLVESGRQVIAQSLEPLIHKLLLFALPPPPHDVVRDAMTMHLRILDAIERRDATLAIERLREHLTVSGREYLASAAEGAVLRWARES
jgi:DNA-binding GntR family transcriptional regulator